MSKEYNIAKPSGRCTACQRPLQPGEEFVATIRETSEDFLREDFCTACWDADGRDRDAGRFGIWRSRVPQPEEKKKRFIDDELLSNFFERLDAAQEPAKINFRFVLALLLMRKKMLVYDRMEKLPDGREVWTMHFKGSDRRHQVVDPHMDDLKIAQVREHLGQILEGEL